MQACWQWGDLGNIKWPTVLQHLWEQAARLICAIVVLQLNVTSCYLSGAEISPPQKGIHAQYGKPGQEAWQEITCPWEQSSEHCILANSSVKLPSSYVCTHWHRLLSGFIGEASLFQKSGNAEVNGEWVLSPKHDIPTKVQGTVCKRGQETGRRAFDAMSKAGHSHWDHKVAAAVDTYTDSAQDWAHRQSVQPAEGLRRQYAHCWAICYWHIQGMENHSPQFRTHWWCHQAPTVPIQKSQRWPQLNHASHKAKPLVMSLGKGLVRMSGCGREGREEREIQIHCTHSWDCQTTTKRNSRPLVIFNFSN